MDTKGYNIEKLNGENYFLWRIKMEMILQREKLWKVVTEDPPVPNVEGWSDKDMSARAIVGLSLEDKLLITVSSCTTAKCMWETLSKTYQHANLSSKLNLLKRLYGCRYQDYPNMEQYLNKIKELTERLKTCGETIKDNHVVAVMLCGLPDKYDAIITAIESKPESELSLEYVNEKLRDEATRREAQNDLGESHDMAMASKYASNERLTTNRIMCFRCRREGHIQKHCTSGLRDRNQTYSSQKGEGGNMPEVSRRERNQHKNFMISDNQFENGPPEIEYDLEEEWALTGVKAQSNKVQNDWILDSGATSHMTYNKRAMINFKMIDRSTFIHLANGDKVEAQGVGNIELQVWSNKGKYETLLLTEVLWVPNLKHQLISVRKLCTSGCSIIFSEKTWEITGPSKQTFKGVSKLNVFILVAEEKPIHEEGANTCIHEWHTRMAHRGLQGIKALYRENMVEDLEITPCQHSDFCDACPLGAMTQKPFRTSMNVEREPFKGIVSDLCGPIKPSSVGGRRYMMLITDCATSYTHLELLTHKSEASEKFIQYLKVGKNFFGYYPRYIKTDGGGEYMDNVLKKFLMDNGILHQTIVPYTPQQNGKSERLNRSILDMAKKMIKGSGLPVSLWGEAVSTAVYIYNRAKRSTSTVTPYEAWFGRKPSVKHLRTFGSESYAFVHRSQRTKLGDNSIKGRLVGYGSLKKCYRLWIEGTNKIVNATTVTFNENPKIEKMNMEGDTKDEIIIPSHYLIEKENEAGGKTQLRRSERLTKGRPAEKLTL